MGNIDWVQFLTDPVTLASVLACVATFATVLTLAGPAFDNGKLTNRLKSVSNRREELRKKSRAALDGEKKSIRVQDNSMTKRFVDRLDLAKMLEDPGVQKKLIQAGLRLDQSGVLLAGLQLDKDLTLSDPLAVAEPDRGDHFGGVGGDGHRLAALGHAKHLDTVDKGPAGHRDLRHRRRPPARAASGTALPLGLGRGEFQGAANNQQAEQPCRDDEEEMPADHGVRLS
jgi:hypothetical protein